MTTPVTQADRDLANSLLAVAGPVSDDIREAAALDVARYRVRSSSTASSVDVDPSKMSVEMAELFGLVCKLSRLRTEHDDALRSNTGHLEAIEQAANKVDQIVDAIPELKAVFAKVHERERQMRAALANTPAARSVGAGEALRLLDNVGGFLDDFAQADLDEGAADAVTVGMVYQQQAQTVVLPRIRAALPSHKGAGE
jgi:hypothetical protein